MSYPRPKIAPQPLVAHRGLSESYPENTLLAYEGAAKAGFTWIEVDTQLTRDMVPVMIHDSTVDRTTNGTGFVCELSLETIRNLDASEEYSNFSNVQIPTLAETLEQVLALDIGLVLEIKPITGQDLEHAVIVAALLNEMWPQSNDKLVVSSFSAPVLLEFRKHAPWAALALATELPPQQPQKFIDMLGVTGFHFNGELALRHDLQPLLDCKADLSAATINNVMTMYKLLDLGIHSVMTDSHLLIEELNQNGQSGKNLQSAAS